MRESLRLRLVLWYGVVLALVVALYGGAVVYQSWRSSMAGVDAELTGYAREIANALTPVADGRFDLDLPADAATYFFRREGGRPYYVIWSPSGELVDQSDPEMAVTGPGATVPGRREVTILAPGGATVLVGRDIGDLARDRWGLILNVMLAGAATLVLAIGGGWFVAGRALAPIKRIGRAARAMSEGDLDARIAVDRTETELEQVASSLNNAFDRLKLALDQQRRFTADASHELRTPISVLRAETEWAQARERTPEQYRDALAVCLRAALRMQETVERLLSLVRAEAPGEAAERTRVSPRALIDDVAAWLMPMAVEREVSLRVSGDPAASAEALLIHGDADRLREAISNVVANAILYNRRGGSVAISTRTAGGMVRIEVVDTGIGIPGAAVPRVFDRFFRVDAARSREVGGSGLGLAIARSIVVAHGGEITCTSEPEVGSVFVISLPLLTASSSLCSPTSP